MPPSFGTKSMSAPVTVSKRPQSLAKNKTRKNIKSVLNFYRELKASETTGDTKTNLEPNELLSSSSSSPSSSSSIENECCKNPNHIQFSEDGFATCSVCATVFTDFLNFDQEWRFYGNDDTKGAEDPSRCGLPSNPYLENNLSCSFATGGYSASKQYASLIRYTNSSNFNHRDKSILEDIQRLTQLGHIANFTQCVIDYAIYIHQKIVAYLHKTEVHFRSDNKNGILYGDFDLACKHLNVPRTIKEFATMWDCDIQVVTAGCKIVQTVFAEIEKSPDALQITHKTISPASFILRFCSHLHIYEPTFSNLCMFVISKMSKTSVLNQHTPQSVAVGTLLFVSENSNILTPNYMTKHDLVRVTGVSDVTISKINNKLFEYHTQTSPLIPSRFAKPNGS